MMNEISNLDGYCELFSTPPSKFLADLERKTHLRTLAPQMCSGFIQGRMLSLLSKLTRPKLILEVGTFTAYSTLCLSEGLQKDGKLYTIEVNPEMEYMIQNAIRESGTEKHIEYIIGDALQIIPKLDGPFELIFLDAAKEEYINYYDLIFDKWADGGLLIADNVLWGGKILDEEKDETTKAIEAFNHMIREDERVENLILPVRDGLSLILKKSKQA